MADTDRMVFPIGFDLETAVTNAGKEWDSKYAKKLENAIAKTPVNVKLQFDTKKLDNLDAVKKKLAELKIEPLNAENKAAIKELTKELNQLAKAMKKLESLRGITIPELQRAQAAKLNKDVALADEKLRMQQERLRISQERLTMAQQKAEIQGYRTRDSYMSQGTYLTRLIKRMAVYASFNMFGNFLTQIREVTAQFELQRISLGAILQDQAKANKLFADIKAFALDSPVSILDLTKYTKQLAAYKIGYEELFDTTKRLTDISVGLGVSMDRVVLAFGQTRASGHLRASEVRQMTEAGLPIVEELAQKLTAMNGQLVTSKDVMDMISKRAISFELVKEVFEDMTSAGGIFYNMQEKQSQTLFGMWAKLGDAVQVMYDEIGNTDAVNSGLKTTIQLISDLMRNWQATAGALAGAGLAIGAIQLTKTANRRGADVYQNKVIAATKRRIQAQQQLNAALQAGSIVDANAARNALKKAAADEKAAIAARDNASRTSKFGKGLLSIGKSLASGALWGAAIAAISAIGAALFGASSNLEKVKEKMSEIMSETNNLIRNSTDNFIRLAERVAGKGVIDGSRDQKEALAELQRTFSTMIPIEELSIENLRRLRSGATDASEAYQTLTDSIESYIVAQQREKGRSEIDSIFREDIKKWKANLRDNFEEEGSDLAAAERFFAHYEKIMAEGTDKLAERFNLDKTSVFFDRDLSNAVLDEALMKTFGDNVEMIEKMKKSIKEDTGDWQSESWITKLAKDSRNLADSQIGWAEGMDNMDASTKKLNEIKQGITDFMANFNTESFSVLSAMGGDQEFAKEQVRINENIKRIANSIKDNADFKKMFEEAGVEIDNGWFTLNDQLVDGFAGSRINFQAMFDALKGKSAPELRKWITEMQKMYEGLVPKNETVAQLQAKLFEIANSIEGLSMKDLKMYMWDGSTEIDKHQKDIQDQIEKHKANLKMLRQTMATALANNAFLSPILQGQITLTENQVKALEQYEEFVKKYVLDKDNDKGTKADPRLQSLQEIANKMAEINKEYEELLKKEGQAQALADTQKLFASTIADMEKVAKKHGFKLPAFDVPQTIEDVKAWYQAIINEIDRLGLKNADKIKIELGFKRDKIAIDNQQREIEKQLKELAERISRTKTAKEFYDKIFSSTGDSKLASKVTASIFGEEGDELQKQLAQQVRKLFSQFKVEVPLDLISPDNRIDYLALEKYVIEKQKELGGIESNTYKELMKIAQEGQKNLAKTYEGYLKDLEKAKTYSDKRIELARYTAKQIAEINASNRPEDEKKRLTDDYLKRERKLQGELEWETFKEMPMYVQMFDDLDNASTTMLTNMKAKLGELKSEWGSTLNPTQLKELQSRLNEIDKQLAKNNPFRTLSDAIKQYKILSKDGSQGDAEKALIKATQASADARDKLNIALDTSIKAQNDYNAAVAKYGANSQQAKDAKLISDAARQGVEDAQKLADSTVLSEEEAQRLVNAWKKVKDVIGLSLGEMFTIASSLSDLASGIATITEALDGSAEDVQYWNDIASGIGEVTSAVESMTLAALTGNPIQIATTAITAIPQLISGFSTLFSAGKVRRANIEIKRQQELLDQLEYAYSRLEKAADKAFGASYISNIRKQTENLEAQAKAYRKQAEAERSKGKKADEDKIKEYENSYRDTMDEIAELQGKIAEQMLGADLTSAARDFAKAWLDAYREFGNTADAMSKKFHEMIENMVVESLLARVMEKALKPAFDMIENMGETDFYSASFWESVIATAQQGAKDADAGAQAMMRFLEKAGISMRDMTSEYTGIQRNIAGASEETMSNVAVIGNTLMYYVSPIPRIDENVAIMRRIMETGANPQSKGVDTTALWNRHLELQQGIYEHTRRSAEKCEIMAIHCKQIADDIHRVIAPKGSSATASMQVRIQS